MAGDCCIQHLPTMPARGDFVVCYCGTVWEREIIGGEHIWRRRFDLDG